MIRFDSIRFYLAWLPILPYLTYFLLISPFHISLPASSPWFFYFNLNLNLLFYLTTSYSLSCTNISFSPSFPLIHSNLFFTILVLVQTSPPPLYSILFHRLLNKVTRRPPSECGYRSYMWIQWSLCSCQGCWMVPTSAWNFGIRGRHCRQVNAECCRRGKWAGGRGTDIIWECQREWERDWILLQEKILSYRSLKYLNVKCIISRKSNVRRMSVLWSRQYYTMMQYRGM